MVPGQQFENQPSPTQPHNKCVASKIEENSIRLNFFFCFQENKKKSFKIN